MKESLTYCSRRSTVRFDMPFVAPLLRLILATEPMGSRQYLVEPRQREVWGPLEPGNEAASPDWEQPHLGVCAGWMGQNCVAHLR